MSAVVDAQLLITDHLCMDSRTDYAPALSVDQWTSVLKLATMWQFDTHRRRAIAELELLLLQDPARRVVLAFAYTIGDWILQALQDLAQRKELMTTAEVKVLGVETVLKICKVRERYAAGFVCRSCYKG